MDCLCQSIILSCLHFFVANRINPLSVPSLCNVTTFKLHLWKAEIVPTGYHPKLQHSSYSITGPNHLKFLYENKDQALKRLCLMSRIHTVSILYLVLLSIGYTQKHINYYA